MSISNSGKVTVTGCIFINSLTDIPNAFDDLIYNFNGGFVDINRFSFIKSPKTNCGSLTFNYNAVLNINTSNFINNSANSYANLIYNDSGFLKFSYYRILNNYVNNNVKINNSGIPSNVIADTNR